MTQSDPTPTPRGSGGVATGSGSGEHEAPDATEKTAPVGRSRQGQSRQRVIPPAKKAATPPEQRTAPAGDRSSGRTTVSGSAKTAQKSAKSATRSPQTGAPASAARTGNGRAPVAGSAPARSPRRARLRLTQIDAWTVMKTSFLLSIALGIVSVVAVAIVWTVLGAAGVFDSLNGTVQTLLGNDFRVQDYIGTGRVLGFTMLIAVVNVVLLTAIATLGAFLYNLSATLLGGIEVTLTEDH